jgi:hypothetical protein
MFVHFIVLCVYLWPGYCIYYLCVYVKAFTCAFNSVYLMRCRLLAHLLKRFALAVHNAVRSNQVINKEKCED